MEDSTSLSGEGSMNEATRQIKDTAENLAQSAKDTVTRGAEATAQKVANSAQDLAATLRNAADAVSGDNGWVGNLLTKSADGIESATSSLSSGDFSAVLNNVNGFARRQPALFVGICVAVGFAAARVGKTAMEQSGQQTPDSMGHQ